MQLCVSFVETRELLPFPVKEGTFVTLLLGAFLFCLHSVVGLYRIR